MKHIREAVHDVIERQILPMVERDGTSNLFLPEQITSEHCADIPKRKRPYIGHPAPEMGIGLVGEMIFWIADKAFIFKPGNMVILPGRTIHTAIQTNWRRTSNLDPNHPPSVLWLTFYPFGVRAQVSHTLDEKDTIEFSSPYVLLGREFHILLKWLIEEVRDRPPYSAGIGRCILSEIMQRLLRAAVAEISMVASISLTSEQFYSGQLAAGKQKGTKRARNGASIGLDEIADAADTSPDHLGRAFKTATGMTPIQYLIDVRMRAAKDLLLTNLKAFEVGQMVGIKNPCRFSRMFRQHAGLSPIQYRRKMAESVKSLLSPQE
jgi:AraC-like DNA-binding protein